MSIYDNYKSDINLRNEGVWINLSATESIKVRAFNCPKHVETLKKLTKPYKSQIERKVLDDEILEDLHMKALAQSILIDWKGIKDEKGKDLECNFQNVYDLLTNETMIDLKAEVIFLAKERQTFVAEEEVEEIKNSGKSSTGT